MKVRLDEIGDEPFTWDVREEIPAVELERDELVALAPVHWRGRIRRLDLGFLLDARLSTEQTLQCQRCLEPVTEPVEADVELLVQPPDENLAVGEVELDEEDLGVYVLEGEELDLDPLLVEQLQLAVPMRPLCREDCAGLCPTCGTNLNAGECACEEEVADPRWSGLAALRDRFAGSEDDG